MTVRKGFICLMITLENQYLKVEFIAESAQISSVVNKVYDLQYIHDGKKDWSQQNPLLFPMISNTYNKQQLINGKYYSMSNHGIFRHREFNLVSQNEDSVVFETTSDESTKELFPFDFKFTVTHRLTFDSLKINYELVNTSDDELPFQFGLHPAFVCPLDKTKQYSDYRIEFECDEHQHGLIGTYAIDGNTIALNHDVFRETPTILLERVNSSWVKLTDGYHGVKVDINGYDHLAFWTPNQAEFVCIEPWVGHGDLKPLDHEVEFKDRPFTKTVQPNESWEIGVNYLFF